MRAHLSGTGPESAGTGPESIYLSDVEPHSAAPFDKAADLRARVLLHVLFADRLLIGDSQSLNNPFFRALVSAEEAGGHQVRPDLAALLAEGRIRVARRAGSTLREVRDSQAARNVENVPPPQYADLLDAMTGAHAVSYDGSVVADRFKSTVLSLVSAQCEGARGEGRAVFEAAREWIASQEPLPYKALRDWRDAYRDSRPGSAEVVLALDVVERSAGESYRQALPGVLDAGTASPLDPQDVILSTRSRQVMETAGLPASMLDAFLLSRLPVEVLLEATAQPARDALVGQLARLRCGQEPDTSVLRAALGEFSAWMREAFARTFRTTDERAWAVLQGHDRLMRFGIAEDAMTGQLGAALEIQPAGEAASQGSYDASYGDGAAGSGAPVTHTPVTPTAGSTAATGSLSFHVRHRPAPGTEQYRVPEQRRPVSELNPRDRVVV